ncbi:MAG: hypothetical protein ACTHQE_10145, partial [Thermomicrobiales bacterium]
MTGPSPNRRSAPSRSTRHRRGSPLFTAFTILTLLIGALSPVFDTSAIAQTVTPEDSSGDTSTQAADQPTETPADQPTADTSLQNPTETPSPTPTETVMNELLGAVNIAYWECPAGTDPASVPSANLESTCTDKRDGVTFAITDG